MEIGTDRRLYRSERERMLAGVCGGLGEYFDVDPVLWRLGFVLLALFGGSGLLVYIVMALIIPERPRDQAQATDLNPGDEGHDAEAGSPPLGETRRSWGRPLTTAETEERQARRRRTGGLILVGLGAIFLLSNLNIFYWVRWDLFWPLLLIGLGLFILVRQRR